MVKYLLRPWILVLTLIGFALLLVPATALAQALPPHLFLGEAGAVTEGPNNEPVKSGTIAAWINDKEVGSATVTDGAYKLFVEQPPGSEFTGEFVLFTVDGSPTDARVMWKEGGADIVPIKVIPAGTLVRVSLARWWRPEDSEPNFEERCYLQLSGWY